MAAAYNLCYDHGLSEGIDNHLTVKIGENMLCIAHGKMWNEVTPENLLKCDLDGNIIEGEGELEVTALYIHTSIHLAPG